MTIDPHHQFPVTASIPDCQNLNQSIIRGFYQNINNPDIKRTHLFNGRYENVYLNETHIPELKDLLNEACTHARRILNQNNIKADCWFNHMPPGSITLLHSHDDDDELLSAAYYMEVPENSGDLIIHTDDADTRITPEAGMFVFFKPGVPHEVTENKNQLDRLSIGINFGPK
jgi:hypothetical protein